jgi:hypothetical protein
MGQPAPRREFRLTPEALAAFHSMMFHKLSLWDAALDLERLIGFEVDTGAMDDLAACLGEPHTSSNLTLSDLNDWLQSHTGVEV